MGKKMSQPYRERKRGPERRTLLAQLDGMELVQRWRGEATLGPVGEVHTHGWRAEDARE